MGGVVRLEGGWLVGALISPRDACSSMWGSSKVVRPRVGQVTASLRGIPSIRISTPRSFMANRQVALASKGSDFPRGAGHDWTAAPGCRVGVRPHDRDVEREVDAERGRAGPLRSQPPRWPARRPHRRVRPGCARPPRRGGRRQGAVGRRGCRFRQAPQPVAQVGDPAQGPLGTRALHDEVPGEAAARAPVAGQAVGIGRRVVGVAVPRAAGSATRGRAQRSHHLPRSPARAASSTRPKASG